MVSSSLSLYVYIAPSGAFIYTYHIKSNASFLDNNYVHFISEKKIETTQEEVDN